MQPASPYRRTLSPLTLANYRTPDGRAYFAPGAGVAGLTWTER